MYATRKLSLGQPITHEGTRGQLRRLPQHGNVCSAKALALRLGGSGGLRRVRRLKIADVAVGYSG